LNHAEALYIYICINFINALYFIKFNSGKLWPQRNAFFIFSFFFFLNFIVVPACAF